MSRSTSARRGKIPCGVCQEPVAGKDEALLCEGECGQWFHRGCASVPPCRYTTLSNSEEAFVCLSCSNVLLKQQITELKDELKRSQDMLSKIAILEAEMIVVRGALISPQVPKPTVTTHKATTAASCT